MSHKTAQQLLDEVTELLKEIEVYKDQREIFFKDLKKIDLDYEEEKFNYLEYEKRRKDFLKGKTREEANNYYNTYIFSLLKKVEFIVSQVFAIVYDDRSFNNLSISRTQKSEEKKNLPVVESKKAEKPLLQKYLEEKEIKVFNIDNEIKHLQDMLASKGITVDQLDSLASKKNIKTKLNVRIPKLSDIMREISSAEENAFKKRLDAKKRIAELARKQEQELIKKEQEKAKVLAAKKAEAEKIAKIHDESQRKQAEEELKKKQEEAKVLAAKKAESVKKSPEKHSRKISFSLPMHLLLLLLKFLIKGIKEAMKVIIDVPSTAFKSLKPAAKMAKGVVKKEAAEQPIEEPEPAKKIAKQPANLVSFKVDTSKPKPEEKKRGSKLEVGEEQKHGIFSAILGLFSSKRKKQGIFVEEIVNMEKSSSKPSDQVSAIEEEATGIAFGWFSLKGLMRELTSKFGGKKESIVGEETTIPGHMKKLKQLRSQLYKEEKLSSFDTTLLAQEAKRVKKILETEKPEVYQGSSIGLIANLTVRKISLFLVSHFPEFFGFLYNALRSANVKVLSNTYVNIMILSTIFIVGASFIVMIPLLFLFGYPLYQVFLRSIILSIVAGIFSATIFYAYPFMKIKKRKGNIMTNMPFAINHMAAVATSGVPPSTMFELIVSSSEYGEIGVELKKVSDFINIFGYDLLTALRTVSVTTPSQPFKEFLEGMISNIETGGDLDTYLRQEADQATQSYNLERQRYNETVSTYSDIYTGLLIAAPLFFVAAMALVNILGGTLGGIGVDVIMALGAYIAIPLLNLGFIAFLQATQPEI
jgi:pilus assembly protein TadC